VKGFNPEHGASVALRLVFEQARRLDVPQDFSAGVLSQLPQNKKLQAQFSNDTDSHALPLEPASPTASHRLFTALGARTSTER
jgi:hypothetical protein